MADPSAIDGLDKSMAKITRRRTSRFWSSRDVAFLKKYAALNYDWRDIATNMPDKKRSPNTVYKKAIQLGLSG